VLTDSEIVGRHDPSPLRVVGHLEIETGRVEESLDSGTLYLQRDAVQDNIGIQLIDRGLCLRLLETLVAALDIRDQNRVPIKLAEVAVVPRLERPYRYTIMRIGWGTLCTLVVKPQALRWSAAPSHVVRGEAYQPSLSVTPPPDIRLVSKHEFHGGPCCRAMLAQLSSGDEVAEVVVRGKYRSASRRTVVPWRLRLVLRRHAADEPEPHVPYGLFAPVVCDDPPTLVVPLLGPGRHSARDRSFAITGIGSKFRELRSKKHYRGDHSHGADGGADGGHPVQRRTRHGVPPHCW
jgi:hypothetical protein